ncbi:hypothetical protein EDB86DRAFT_2825173 [Lactarius hatsudake]|nr:hypothetical protein EDB86DRAFT_2825173 [Lactarius hatsudake]
MVVVPRAEEDKRQSNGVSNSAGRKRMYDSRVLNRIRAPVKGRRAEYCGGRRKACQQVLMVGTMHAVCYARNCLRAAVVQADGGVTECGVGYAKTDSVATLQGLVHEDGGFSSPRCFTAQLSSLLLSLGLLERWYGSYTAKATWVVERVKARSLSRRLASPQRDTKIEIFNHKRERYQRFHIVGSSVEQVSRVSPAPVPRAHYILKHICSLLRTRFDRRGLQQRRPGLLRIRPARHRAGPSFGCSGGPANAVSTGRRVRAWGPVVGRIELMLRHDIGNFAEESRRHAYGEVSEENGVAYYLRNMKGRPS